MMRMRFVAVFVAAFVVVGKWDVLRNYWDMLTRPGAALDTTANAVSLDTEYFCPMDPGVVSDWSGKCGICNMSLVRRKKGEMVHLPDGVVARMQLSPYRVQLAGIQTSAVSYRPLVREVQAVGRVARRDPTETENVARPIVHARVFERDLPLIAAGQVAEIRYLARDDVWRGKVGAVESAEPVRAGSIEVPIELESAPEGLREGMSVTVRIQVAACDLEPFRALPRTLPPLAPDAIREVFRCPDHPDVLKIKPGNCPLGKNALESRQLADNQRVDWWCPMHPRVTSETAGAECRECNGMKLLPRVVSFMPVGEVLAVADSAVIDTGTKKVVYVERSPGLFDGVEVVLGPRCGDYFPVIKGIEAGQRVATSGAFLIDAETRLNPSAAASYFGAGTGSK
jgi:hypothetical protein